MKASELDKKFDDNQEDVLHYFDTSKIRMINEKPKRINISHQAVIKMWLAEKLQSLNVKAANV